MHARILPGTLVWEDGIGKVVDTSVTALGRIGGGFDQGKPDDRVMDIMAVFAVV